MAMPACCFADNAEATSCSIQKETRQTRRVKFQEEALRERSAEVISLRFGCCRQDRITTGILDIPCYRRRASGLLASLAAINRDVQLSQISATSSETRPSAKFSPSDMS